VQQDSHGIWSQLADATSDFFKSIPRGVANTGAELLEGAAQTGQGENTGIGVTPDQFPIPTEQQMFSMLGGESTHKPEGLSGRIGQSIGSAVSNPLSYLGPGALPIKIAGAALSGAGSEVGNEVGGTPGAIVGGVLGGSLAGIPGKIGAALSNTRRAAEIPTTSELFDSADAKYGEARQLGVLYQKDNVSTLVDNIKKELAEDGFDADEARSTFGKLEKLDALGEGDDHPSFSQIEQIRKGLNRTANAKTILGGATEDANAARRAIGYIDDFFQDPSNAVIRAGMGDEYQASRVAQLVQDARDEWSAASGSKQIESALLTGEHRAGVSGSGANIENTTRQEIRKILDNPKRVRSYSPEEREMMQQIVMGTVPTNSARLLGKLAATGIVSAAGTSYLAKTLGLGLAGHVALPLAALGVKKAGEYATRQRVSRLLQSIRADTPLARSRGVPPVTPSPSAGPYAVRGLTGALPYISGNQP
jgi:hypothetical protein